MRGMVGLFRTHWVRLLLFVVIVSVVLTAATAYAATPSCSITASPATIPYGSSSNISWSETDANQVNVNNVGYVMMCITNPDGSCIAGTYNSSGSFNVSPRVTTDYSCTPVFYNPTTGVYTYGPVAPASVTVLPPPLPSATITATQSTINVGQSTTINATFTAGSGDTITADNIDSPPGTGLGANTNAGPKSYTFTPSAAGTYTFYARAQTQYYTSWATYAQVTVTVNPPATACAISFSPTSILRGQSSALTWTTTNASSGTISPTIGNAGLSGTWGVSPSNTTLYNGTAVKSVVTTSTGAVQTIVLTSGTTWTVPADWNNASNTIEAVGAGGNGGSSVTSPATGGGGGGYAKIVNFSATAGDVIPIVIGTGGSQTNTMFKNGTTLVAAAGLNGSLSAAGSGGSANVGTVTYAGGDGSNAGAKLGGGGAAGPLGRGGSGAGGGGGANRGASVGGFFGQVCGGAAGSGGFTSGCWQVPGTKGGGGGGGGGSTAAGQNTSTTAGGAGGATGGGTGGTGVTSGNATAGANATGTGGGGAGGTAGSAAGNGGNGGSGSGGGGGGQGGGAYSATGVPGAGGNGGMDSTWGSYGVGGGGGGGGSSNQSVAGGRGGNGGSYGGGGGAGGTTASGSAASTGGTGGDGIIIIRYAPIVTTTTDTSANCSSTLSVTCAPIYSCSGNTIQYTDGSCNTSDVATCAAPSFCQPGQSACVNPNPLFVPTTANDGSGTTFSYTGHLQARPALIRKGASGGLYWNVTNVASCAVSGNGDSWSAASSSLSACAHTSAGGCLSSAINSAAWYTLVCAALGGGTAVNETVQIVATPIYNEQ